MYENKRWVIETIARHDTGAVPFNFSFTPPARQMAKQHYKVQHLEEELNFPIRMGAPVTIKPLYASPDEYGETIKDEYGVTWNTSRVDRGAPIIPALSEPDLSGYKFPDPSAAYRFEHIGEWCEANKEHFTMIWVGDLWERATFMRGMENILLDIALNPHFVHGLLRGITDYVLKTVSILCERYTFDCIALSDDYGTQKAMLMSPADWRRFIKPLLAEIYAVGKDNGKVVFHHSCGNIEPVIGDMIDIGLDILHPIQPEAMDIRKLKQEFGRSLSFCGGIRTQDLLPSGTPKEVAAEVRELKHVMGKGGGYILEPGITVQTDVPLANIVAMIDESRKDSPHA